MKLNIILHILYVFTLLPVLNVYVHVYVLNVYNVL